MPKSRARPILVACALLAPCAAAAETLAVDAMLEYLEFTEYQGGNLLPEQIPAADYAGLFIIDARRPEDFVSETIPGAVNIEWRQVLARRDEVPRDRPVLLFCNTGSLSAQAAFALKVAGHDNVKILTGGFDSWRAKGGLAAHERATSPRL
ncbi:MAG: rhodanese-like domain-containing protein [Gammaproteobacteria bacterium]|nr:rhodanese-like domain-containing protein [Gammaproteobacteria bacterium]